MAVWLPFWGEWVRFSDSPHPCSVCKSPKELEEVWQKKQGCSSIATCRPNVCILIITITRATQLSRGLPVLRARGCAALCECFFASPPNQKEGQWASTLGHIFYLNREAPHKLRTDNGNLTYTVECVVKPIPVSPVLVKGCSSSVGLPMLKYNNFPNQLSSVTYLSPLANK